MSNPLDFDEKPDEIITIHDLPIKQEPDDAEEIKINTQQHSLNCIWLESVKKEDVEAISTDSQFYKAGSDNQMDEPSEGVGGSENEYIDSKVIKQEADSIAVPEMKDAKQSKSFDIEINPQTVVFEKESKLEKLIREWNEKDKQKRLSNWYYCASCSVKTRRKQNLAIHIRRIHSENCEVYKCKLCKFKSKYKKCLKNHSDSKHGDTRYACEFCEYTTNTYQNLYYHFKVKHDEKAEWHCCHLCSYKTKNIYSLNKHVRNCHMSDAGIFRCDACRYKTIDRNLLRFHVNKKHS